MPGTTGETKPVPSRFKARLRFRLRTLAAFAAVAAICSLAIAGWGAPKAPVVVLQVDGIIGPAAADYVTRGLAEARAADAPLVVLTLDTPGGLDGSMREIIRAILASPIPVATYVSPSGARAASAGTYILYASHIAAMAPGTNLGAATPVQLFGLSPDQPNAPEKPARPGQPAADKPAKGGTPPAGAEAPSHSETMTLKMTNDAVAYIRSLAKLRGRNADWAEQAVRKAVSLPADQAAQQGVVDFVANDVTDLLAKANGRKVSVLGTTATIAASGATLKTIEPGWRTQLLALITDPQIAYLLFLLGVFGIVFELAHPGMAAPGVVGTISLIVGLFGLNYLPIDYSGAALLVLGLGLMVAEVFVPAYGALGLGGVAAFAIGSLMLFDTNVPAFQLSAWTVAGASVAAALVLLIVLNLAIKARRRPVVTGEATLIGVDGEVLDWSDGEGQVQVGAERWHARGAASLREGQRVRVTARDGLTLVVGPDIPNQA